MITKEEKAKKMLLLNKLKEIADRDNDGKIKTDPLEKKQPKEKL